MLPENGSLKVKGRAEADIHVVLNYIVSKAVLEGKVGHSTITVPLTELIAGYEGYELDEKIQDYALTVRIETMWDEAPLEPEDFDSQFSEEEEN